MSRIWSIGACHSAEDTESHHLSGLDFREIPLSLVEDGALDLHALDPPAVLSMGVFPPGMQLFGSPDSVAAAMDRADRVVDMVGAAGLAGITFGAGAVRSIPADCPREKGLEILGNILGRLQRRCDDIGIGFFLENLPPVQSNVFNMIREIADFCDRFDLVQTKILFDLRAAALANDELTALDAYLDRIGHIHLTYPETVLPPAFATDAFLRRLDLTAYSGRIAIEPVGARWSSGTAELARRARHLLDGSAPLAEAQE